MSLVRDFKWSQKNLKSDIHCLENSLQVEDIQNKCQHAQGWPSKQVHP